MEPGKVTTTLSSGIVSIVFETRGVLPSTEMRNFLNQVRGRKKAMEIAGHFTSNIPALVEQLKKIESNYYRQGRKGSRMDRDIGFIRRLYKRLDNNDDHYVHNYDHFCEEYHNEDAYQAGFSQGDRTEQDFGNTYIRTPNKPVKKESNRPRPQTIRESSNISNFVSSSNNNFQPIFASTSSNIRTSNKPVKKESNGPRPQTMGESSNVPNFVPSSYNNFQPIFASTSSYIRTPNKPVKEESNGPRPQTMSESSIVPNFDSSSNNDFQPIFASTSFYIRTPSKPVKEESNGPRPQTMTESSIVPNFGSSSNNHFQPIFASTSSSTQTSTKPAKKKSNAQATVSLSSGVQNIICKTRGHLPPHKLCNFLKHVRGKENATEIARHFTSNITSLVSQLQKVEANYYKQGKKGARMDKDIEFIRRLGNRLQDERSEDYFVERYGKQKAAAAAKVQSSRRRKATLSRGTIKIISKTSGELVPYELCNFLKKVRGKKKATEIAIHFTPNIPALLSQLQDVETFSKLGKKSVGVKRDIDFIRRLRLRLQENRNNDYVNQGFSRQALSIKEEYSEEYSTDGSLSEEYSTDENTSAEYSTGENSEYSFDSSRD